MVHPYSLLLLVELWLAVATAAFATYCITRVQVERGRWWRNRVAVATTVLAFGALLMGTSDVLLRPPLFDAVQDVVGWVAVAVAIVLLTIEVVARLRNAACRVPASQAPRDGRR